MFTKLALAFLFVLGAAWSQPSFDAAHILPNGATEAEPLVQSRWYSIYGTGLGPKNACTGLSDGERGYPIKLCGVQILLNGQAMPLNLVSSKQINFFAEVIAPGEGTVQLSHVFGGRAETTTLFRGKTPVALDIYASSVGMPVWLGVKIPNRSVQFPVTADPQQWGCHHVEVWRDGELLPRRPAANNVIIRSGPGPCSTIGLPGVPWDTDRLPLHLIYNFNTPGNYVVRYTLRAGGGDGTETLGSAQMGFRLRPEDADQRRGWLSCLYPENGLPCLDSDVSHGTSAVELLTDFLPTIAGFKDEYSRQLLSWYVDHDDAQVRAMARSLLELK
jgi:hypothetical protein